MNYIGVDPDTHNSALAVFDDAGRIVGLAVVQIDKSLKEDDAVIGMARAIDAELGRFFASVKKGQNLAAMEVACVTVEGQELAYTAKSGRNPRSMLGLCAVAGAWLHALHAHTLPTAIEFPKPQAWKGSVPKPIHHARILGGLGFAYDVVGASKGTAYCRPRQGDGSPADLLYPGLVAAVEAAYGRAAWKHLVDAMGLALWGKAETERKSRRAGQLLSAQK